MVVLVGYFLTISIATGLTLDVGANLPSYLRAGFWFLSFALLYPLFSRCDYRRVSDLALWCGLLLALLHIVQAMQAIAGLPILRIVPNSWYMAGHVRWNEEWATPRPAAIFTEISWYAFYQIVVLCTALLWSPYTPLKRDWYRIAIICMSILISGSLVGIVLLFALIGIWLTDQGHLRARHVLLIMLCGATVLGGFLGGTSLGRTTLARILFQQGEGSFALRVIVPWVRVYSVLQTNPLAGVGIGNEANAGLGAVRVQLPEFNNVYAYFLATTGLLGFSGLLSFIAFVGRKHWKEMALFLLFGFAHGYGITEHFWIPALLWASGINQRRTKVIEQPDTAY